MKWDGIKNSPLRARLRGRSDLFVLFVLGGVYFLLALSASEREMESIDLPGIVTATGSHY